MGPSGTSRNRRPQDYYQVLGVAPESTFRAIEAAYWARVNNEAYRKDIALLNQAYEVIGHAQRRADYDALRAERAEQEPEETPEPQMPRRGNPGLRSKLEWFLQ